MINDPGNRYSKQNYSRLTLTRTTRLAETPSATISVTSCRIWEWSNAIVPRSWSWFPAYSHLRIFDGDDCALFPAIDRQIVQLFRSSGELETPQKGFEFHNEASADKETNGGCCSCSTRALLSPVQGARIDPFFFSFPSQSPERQPPNKLLVPVPFTGRADIDESGMDKLQQKPLVRCKRGEEHSDKEGRFVLSRSS